MNGTIGSYPASLVREMILGAALMQPKKEIYEECQSMSALSKDPETKALWQGMAERWTLCAKLTEQEDGSVVRSKKGEAAD